MSFACESSGFADSYVEALRSFWTIDWRSRSDILPRVIDVTRRRKRVVCLRKAV